MPQSESSTSQNQPLSSAGADEVLDTLPAASVLPPVPGQADLPFNALSPGQFERLCKRLIEQDAAVEHCYLYGKPGEKQFGIDIVVRRVDGQRWAYQCKRYESYTLGNLRAALKTLIYPADRCFLLVSCDVGRALRDEVEGRRPPTEIWNVHELSDKLRSYPDLVTQFFGPDWYRMFCGVSLSPSAGIYERKALGDKKISIYTYRILVADHEEVRVEVNIPGRQLAGELRGSFGYTGKVAARIQQLREMVTAAGSESFEVKELGETLFTALFDDNLRRDFFGFYNQAQREDALLRIELDVDERKLPDVAALPWELMRVPSGTGYPVICLGTAPGVGFSRRRVGWPKREPVQLRSNERLRIALVVADPGQGESGPVEYKDIWQYLKELAHLLPDQIELLELVDQATAVTIDGVLEQKPHIFHFVGHARLEANSQGVGGEIALLDDWVNIQRFGELFSRYRSCIVILQACQSAPPSAPQAFMEAASQLIQQNVPAVIVTQYGVSVPVMGRFISAFYNRLSQHEPVDKAAQEARRRISLAPGRSQQAIRDSAAPALFMSVRDGYPFQPIYPGTRKVPALAIHYELNRKDQIAKLESILGRGGGGIIVWGRPHAGHEEFKHIAIHIMRRRGITVLNPIDAKDLEDAPIEEHFLSALDQRLEAEIALTGRENKEASARLWSALRNHSYSVLSLRRSKQLQREMDDRLDRIVTALQYRLDQGPTAIIFFALEGVKETSVLHWLWERVWVAHLERLTFQGLWALFFADSSSGKHWWKSSSTEPQVISLRDIAQTQVAEFFVKQLLMSKSDAERRAENIFEPLLPLPVEPDNLYAALEDNIKREGRL